MRNAGRIGSFGAVLIVLVCTHIAPASAQDAGTLPGIILDSYPIPEPQAIQVVQPLGAASQVVQPFRAGSQVVEPFRTPTAEVAQPLEGGNAPVRRPSALMPLYGSLAVLQGLDMHSTMKGIGSNGSEANPVMRPFVDNGAAFFAMKSSVTLGVIWVSEKMWRKHRKAAVVSVFVLNVVMAGVVANNYRVNQ